MWRLWLKLSTNPDMKTGSRNRKLPLEWTLYFHLYTNDTAGLSFQLVNPFSNDWNIVAKDHESRYTHGSPEECNKWTPCLGAAPQSCWRACRMLSWACLWPHVWALRSSREQTRGRKWKRTKTRVISSRLDLVSVSAQVSNLFSSVRFHEVLASVVDTGKSHQMTFFRPADS